MRPYKSILRWMRLLDRFLKAKPATSSPVTTPRTSTNNEPPAIELRSAANRPSPANGEPAINERHITPITAGGAVVTGGRLILAPERGSGESEAMELGWTIVDKLIPFLTIANQALSGLPFQGAVAGPLQLLKTFQAYHANNEQLKQLPDQLENIRKIIEPIPTTPNARQAIPKTLIADCKKLSSELEEIAQNLDKFKSQGFGNKLLSHADIANALADATTQINTALLKSNAGGSIQIRIEQWKEAPLHLRQWLSPAPDSGYDSKTEDGEPLTCLEGTRTELLETIHKWFDDPDSKPFFWLSGLAGTGKSTIARTVARDLKAGIKANSALGGSFFFSRWEFNITNPFLVFPTLAYQLCLYDDSFLEHVHRSRKEHHGVPTSKSLQDQFNKLILEPLLHSKPGHEIIVIIIDALDEGGEGVASVISHLVGIPQLPFRLKVFVTSREEPSAFFRSGPFRYAAPDCQLHNIEESIIRHDIERYLSSRLGSLRPEEIPAPWPSSKDLEVLVAKTDQLFIYAATVVKFIGDTRWSDPQGRLNRLLLTSKADAGSSPLHELDTMYRRVLEEALAIGDRFACKELVIRFKTVVGAVLLLQSPLPVASLEALLSIPNKIIPAVRALHSVFIVPEQRYADTEGIRSFHPSFPEFLLKRCSPQEPFFIDEQMHHARLATLCLQCISGIDDHSIDQLGDHPIPTHVQYACLHWGDHLSNASFDNELLTTLYVFGSQYILRWAELFPRIEYYPTSFMTKSLMQACQWAISWGGSDALLTLLNDAKWFLPAYMDTMGLRLYKLGRGEEAIKLWSSAAGIYLQTCGDSKNVKRPAVFQPDEEGFIHCLLTVSESQKQVDEALKVFEKAAKMRGLLVASGPNELRHKMTWFFDRLSLMLLKMEHFEEALYVAEEAVPICRALYDEHPVLLQADLDSLPDGIIFISEPDLESNVRYFIRPSYPSKDPDVFRGELVSVLERVCYCCWKLESFEKGLQASEELVSVQRPRASKQPGNFRADLAGFLNSLCMFCEKTGNFEKELLAREELVSVCRPLATEQPDIFQRRLAISLNNIGWLLQQLGRLDEALQVAQESLDMSRALATGELVTWDSQFLLAAVLDTVAVCLQKLGQHDHAWQLGHESTIISRQTLETNPRDLKFRRSHLKHLEHHIKSLASLKRTEESDKIMKEIAAIKQNPHDSKESLIEYLPSW